MSPKACTLQRQLAFIWASKMASDTPVCASAASPPLPFLQAVLVASEKSTAFVRQLLQSSTSAVLNARGEFHS